MLINILYNNNNKFYKLKKKNDYYNMVLICSTL